VAFCSNNERLQYLRKVVVAGVNGASLPVPLAVCMRATVPSSAAFASLSVSNSRLRLLTLAVNAERSESRLNFEPRQVLCGRLEFWEKWAGQLLLLDDSRHVPPVTKGR
jgi:hypothetical protein